MNSTDGEGQSGASSFKKGKSISGKLSSFFNSKSGHINAFRIELDDPIKQYGPGDSVKGKVVLNLARTLGVTHITVCLYGYVQVVKAHSRPKDPTRINGNRVAKGRSRRWVSEYYGDGFASLFEEELVLCQEGRLDPKSFHFEFVIDFPSGLDLPTSVDFERGTISYVVSATITRTGGIAPSINTFDTKVRFRDNIDVSKYSIPKPRIATLEPVEQVKGTKLRRLTSYGPDNKRGSILTDQSSRTGLSEISRETVEAPPTPSGQSIRSDISGAERNRKVSWDRSSAQLSHSTRQDGEGKASKIITVTAELSRGACLPGDVVPVQVTIQHTKPVRSLNGIIVTLYRQGRVDMHPNLPLASTDGSGSTLQYEDYYPRSRTGLGGLSLSAAGSSQVWRKDISQTFAPLFVDPQTLTASVKVPVRVPDELYQIPSIRNVPGEMISFKYHVEVIVDIHGKLALTDRAVSNLSTTALHSSYQVDRVMGSEDSRDHSLSALGSGCMDTTAMRRNKAVVTHVCDLVVGTTDSQKRSRIKEGKAAVRGDTAMSASLRNGGPRRHDDYDLYVDDFGSEASHYQYYGPEYDYGYGNGYDYEYEYDPQYGYPNGYDQYYGYGYGPEYDEQYHYGHPASNNNHAAPPMPNGYHDPNISEKERQRLYENSLLPSRPAPEGGSAADIVPSAPSLPEEHHSHPVPSAPPAWQPRAPSGSSVNDFAMTSRSAAETAVGMSMAGASASTGAELNQRVSDATWPATDDKAELERRRLAQQASAPPAVNTAATRPPPASGSIVPSAPPEMSTGMVPVPTAIDGQMLHTNGTHDSITDERLLETPSNPESLPRYEG